MLLGVHCSISGGVENACIEAERLGIDAIQIFTKNQRQWKDRIFSLEEGNCFKEKMKSSKVIQGFSHATYLINPASTDEGVHKNSLLALKSEMVRCHELGLTFSVLHPGANKGLSELESIKRIADSLKHVLDETKDIKVEIALENTAGQGASIGWKIEQLKQIKDIVQSERIGFCIDTCHAFAAGYDIRTQTGCDDFFALLEKNLGIDNILAFHFNDSKGDLGSRIDRHENIGKGKIGLEPFQYVLNKFQNIPKVLETPKENNMDEENLKLLRSLVN